MSNSVFLIDLTSFIICGALKMHLKILFTVFSNEICIENNIILPLIFQQFFCLHLGINENMCLMLYLYFHAPIF